MPHLIHSRHTIPKRGEPYRAFRNVAATLAPTFAAHSIDVNQQKNVQQYRPMSSSGLQLADDMISLPVFYV